MRRIWWLSLALACGDEESMVDIEDIRGQAEAALAAHSTESGSVGFELVGHGSSWYSTMFDESCIQGNEIGWVEDEDAVVMGEKTAYFIPDYRGQQWITATTDDGYCLYMGEDVTYSVVDVKEDSEGRELEANPVTITWSISVSDPSPYFECLRDSTTSPTITLKPNQAFVEPEALTIFDNDCRGMPKPYDREEAGGKSFPDSDPPSPPSQSDIRELLKDMDDALAERDLEAALELTQCYNLTMVESELPEEDEEWMPTLQREAIGACIPSDLLDSGPAFQDSDDPWLVPWLEGRIDSSDKVGKIWLEKGSNGLRGSEQWDGQATKTVYHVELLGTEKKADSEKPWERVGSKSISVQWVDGGWKLIGIVDDLNQGISPVRYVNDLHGQIVKESAQVILPNTWYWRVDRWFVFWDRLHGRHIDEIGCTITKKNGECDFLQSAAKAFNKEPRHQRR